MRGCCSLAGLVLFILLGDRASAQMSPAPLPRSTFQPEEKLPAPKENQIDGPPPPVFRITDANPMVGPPPRVCEEPEVEEDVDIPGLFGIRAEYLSWRVRQFNINTPLAVSRTTGEALLGNQDVNLGIFSGGRVGGTFWLRRDHRIAIDLNGFLLEQRSAYRGITADETGTPRIDRPYFLAPANDAAFFPISIPGQLTGKLETTIASRLAGAEANFVFNFWERDDGRLRFDLIAGYRYADLSESMQVRQHTRSLLAADSTLTINVGGLGTLSNGASLTVTDLVRTSNYFNGGQVGLRGTWQGRWMYVTLAGRSAFGSTRERIQYSGNTTLQQGTRQTQRTTSVDTDGDGVNDTTTTTTTIDAGSQIGAQANQGLYVYPTNQGSHARSFSSVVSELNFTLGFNITPHWRAYAGYSGLYWTNVARAGQQFDLSVSPSQQILSTNFLPNAGGATRPTVPFQRTDFWAHGWNLGVEFEF